MAQPNSDCYRESPGVESRLLKCHTNPIGDSNVRQALGTANLVSERYPHSFLLTVWQLEMSSPWPAIKFKYWQFNANQCLILTALKWFHSLCLYRPIRENLLGSTNSVFTLESKPLLNVVANAQTVVQKLKCLPKTKFLVHSKDVVTLLLLIWRFVKCCNFTF